MAYVCVRLVPLSRWRLRSVNMFIAIAASVSASLVYRGLFALMSASARMARFIVVRLLVRKRWLLRLIARLRLTR